MSAVLARGAAWPAVIGLTLCAAVVGSCSVAVGQPSALVAIAVALLGAAGGFALDEPAAAIADVAPLAQLRVLAARGTALVPQFLVGGGIAVLVGRAAGPSARDYAVALVGGPILGFALANLARRRIDEPGGLVSILIVLIVVITSFVPVVSRDVHLVPTTLPTSGPSANCTWTIILAACIVILASTGRRPRR